MTRRKLFQLAVLAPFSAFIAKIKPSPKTSSLDCSSTFWMLDPTHFTQRVPKLLVVSLPSSGETWLQKEYIQSYKDSEYKIKYTTTNDINGLEMAKIFNDELT